MTRPRDRIAGIIALIAVITFVDLLAPTGVVVRLLLVIPILLTSLSDDPREPGVVFVAALAAFLLVTLTGGPPLSPPEIYLLNRVIVVVLLFLSFLVARHLRGQRLIAEGVRAEAAARGDLNRMLLALLAHDLRSPLTMAGQALDYAVGAARSGQDPDVSLLDDVRARLRRSLRATEIVLDVARRDVLRLDRGLPVEPAPPPASLADELEAEVRSFEFEARGAGSRIETDWSAVPPGTRVAEPLAARQALAIVVDNAIRHGRPGVVRVRGWIDGHRAVCVEVDDPGPRAAHAGGTNPHGGSGLGLELCRTLLASAGGGLEWPDGHGDHKGDGGGARTTVRLRMPQVDA